jgi:hypothetical protein
MKPPHLPYFDGEQPPDDVELDVEDAFGDHTIEYWVHKAHKLIPATDDQVAQVARIHEWERESRVRARLAAWQRMQARSWAARLLHRTPFRCASWIRQRVGQQRTSAQAEREQEQHSHVPVRPQTAGRHDEHAGGTTL